MSFIDERRSFSELLLPFVSAQIKIPTLQKPASALGVLSRTHLYKFFLLIVVVIRPVFLGIEIFLILFIVFLLVQIPRRFLLLVIVFLVIFIVILIDERSFSPITLIVRRFILMNLSIIGLHAAVVS